MAPLINSRSDPRHQAEVPKEDKHVLMSEADYVRDAPQEGPNTKVQLIETLVFLFLITPTQVARWASSWLRSPLYCVTWACWV
jgi:hypothetical protein